MLLLLRGRRLRSGKLGNSALLRHQAEKPVDRNKTPSSRTVSVPVLHYRTGSNRSRGQRAAATPGASATPGLAQWPRPEGTASADLMQRHFEGDDRVHAADSRLGMHRSVCGP